MRLFTVFFIVLAACVVWLNSLFYYGYLDVLFTEQVLFTSHKCIGGYDMELWRIKDKRPDLARTEIDFSSMQCQFDNLYLLEHERFVYRYKNQKPKDAYLLKDFFGVRGLRLEFLPMVTGAHLESTPAAIVFSTCRPKNYPNGANTPGHDFDYIFTAWKSLYNFHFGPDSKVYVHPVSSKRCDDIQSKFWQTLGNEVTFSSSMFNVAERMIFSNMIVAAKKKYELPMIPPDSVVIRAYTSHALRSLEIEDEDIGCVIGVNRKSRRHRFLNNERILESLRYKGGCDVVQLASLGKLTAKEEIAMIRSLSTYITPGGGGSISGIFVRDNARLIVGKICWPVGHSDGGLEKITFVNKAVDFDCRRSDNLLWDNIHWIKISFVGPQRTTDLRLDSKWESDGPWASTTNAFSFSYNVSIPILNDRLDIHRRSKHMIFNVGGFMKSGTGIVANSLQKAYDASMLRGNVPQNEANYMLTSKPALDLFKTCETQPGYLPSVGKFACREFQCTEEIEENFWSDFHDHWNEQTHYLVLKTPTISYGAMEACFAPDILHFHTIRHPMYWSQQYYWKVFNEERGSLTEGLYSTLKMMQSIRMLLETKQVSLDRLWIVRYEGFILRRRLEVENDGKPDPKLVFDEARTKLWLRCTEKEECNKCLGIAQKALGNFGYNMLNPYEPVKPGANEKMLAFEYAHILPTLKEAETEFYANCVHK